MSRVQTGIIKRGPQLTHRFNIKKAINIVKLMEEGLDTELEELEEVSEEEPIEDIDLDEEDYNEDSEHPSSDWEVEWSPWCEDTETISLREFLRNNFDCFGLKRGERKIVAFILQQDSDKETREAIEQCDQELIREKLRSLVEIYDFNHYTPEFEREILPDVVLRREKKDGEWDFQIEVPIQFAGTVSKEQEEDWIRTLTDFTTLLVDAMPKFFEAENFELAMEERNKRLKSTGWTQESLARAWFGKEPETKEKERRVHAWENVISKIKNYRYIQIDFFNKQILPFSFFFRKRRKRSKS